MLSKFLKFLGETFENGFFRIASYFSVAIIVMLFGTYAYSLTMVEHIFSLRAQVGDFFIEGSAEKYEQMESVLKENTEDLALLGKRRLANSDFAQFFAELEGSASQNGLTQTIAQFKATEKDKGKIPEYPLPVERYSVTVEGPLTGVIAYLKFMGSMPPLIAIEKVDATAASAENADIKAASLTEIVFAVAVTENNDE